MIWYDMIWYDMIWYDMIWYDMIWYDMIYLMKIIVLSRLVFEFSDVVMSRLASSRCVFSYIAFCFLFLFFCRRWFFFPGPACCPVVQWSLDHLKMYTLNDVQSSLLPELLHPDDAVLSVKSTAKVRTPRSHCHRHYYSWRCDALRGVVFVFMGVRRVPEHRQSGIWHHWAFSGAQRYVCARFIRAWCPGMNRVDILARAYTAAACAAVAVTVTISRDSCRWNANTTEL